MEKVVCALWRNLGEAREAFNARQIRLNLCDAAVDPAAGLVQQWQRPQQDAVVQYWLPSANALFRGPARLRANRDAMMASRAQFIDFSRIDILPTSQFDFA